MNTLEYLRDKYNLDISQRIVDIPGTTRVTLAELFAHLDFCEGAEIGVEQGKYSEVLCGKNPNLHLHAIDAWTAYPSYREHVSQHKLDDFQRLTIDRLKNFNAAVIKGFSMDVVKKYPDESLDFVYIDSNHEFIHVANDIYEWSKKVKKGGIVAGHDYIKKKNMDFGVVQAVNGYCDAYNIHPLFILGSKHDKPGKNRDRSRSWFYVKT